MSSLHVAKRPTVVPPGRSLVKSLNRPHPRITPHRTAVTFDPSVPPGSEAGLALDNVTQYNDIVKEDASLTLRSLPPVKLSIKNSKTKFMKSPRDDETSSRILRPHLTLKTHSPGHHVFTEGISRNSELPHPSFALQQLKVPYSNLPDNIRIYKEKDRFAFGVKTNREEVISPYKLAPKPKGIQVIDLQSQGTLNKLKGIQLDVKGVKNITENPRKEVDRIKPPDIKSNVIRLDPILAVSESSYETDAAKEPIIGPATEPLAPANSFFVTENTRATLDSVNTEQIRQAAMNTENSDKLKPLVREGRLSVVSIGDNVTSTVLENQKRKARQLYPLYDHKTRVKETYKKMKFKTHVHDLQSSRKPKPLPETFTYKISTRSFGYGNDNPVTNIKPIRNNLPREYSRERSGQFYDDPTDEERRMREYFEPQLRKYYSKYSKRGQYRPRSGDSDESSTDMSQLPANPPPSEISHIHSEDMVMNYTEPRADMLTVHEERTQTAELMSAKKRGAPDNSNVELGGQITGVSIPEHKDNPNTNCLPNNTQEQMNTDRSESKTINNDNETIVTDTDILMDKVNENAYRVPDNKEDLGGSVTDRYAPIAETSKENTQISTTITLPKPDADLDEPNPIEDVQTTQDNDLLSVPTILTDSQKSLTSKKSTQKVNPNKQFLPVPTVSLDKLSHHPLLPNIRDRTSLSRSLQNIAVDEQKYGTQDLEHDSDSSDPDKLSLRIKDLKASIPVTKLRLFSSSTSASIQAPSVNVTDEFGEHHLVYENYYGNERDSELDSRKTHEKKLVSSSNIAFISPLKFEARAKRQ